MFHVGDYENKLITEMNKSLKLKGLHRFGTLIDNLKILGPNLK